METKLHGLRTVIYPAANLESSKLWWSTLLGQAPYFDEPFYVGFNVGGYELGLLPDADVADGAQAYWGVGDVTVAVSEAVADGAVVLTEPTDVGEGIITATLRTPDGNVLGLIHNPHFSAQ